jgi:hypothetical protein
MKLAFSLLLCMAASSHVVPSDFWVSLFKSQNEYLHEHIAKEQQTKYFTLLHFANIIHPRVVAEINKMNPSALDGAPTVSILEGFKGYNEVSGVIWRDSLYYAYNYGADKKLVVAQKTFAQLSDTTKTILTHFSNWDHPLFAISGPKLTAPADHPFFLASQYHSDSSPSVETIAFYYSN